MEALATAAALLAVAVLAIVLISVAKRGLPAINIDFFTQNAAPFGADRAAGSQNAIVGTLIIIGHRDRDRASGRRPAGDLQHRVRPAGAWPRRSA